MKKKINRIGLSAAELDGIFHPIYDSANPLLSTDLAQAIVEKVVKAIYLNNEKITRDLAKAAIVIPD